MNDNVHVGQANNKFQNMKLTPLFFSALSVQCRECHGFSRLAGWASPRDHPEVVSIRVRGRLMPWLNASLSILVCVFKGRHGRRIDVLEGVRETRVYYTCVHVCTVCMQAILTRMSIILDVGMPNA